MKIFAAFLPSLTWLIPTYLFILLVHFPGIVSDFFLHPQRCLVALLEAVKSHWTFPILSCFTTAAAAAAAKSLQLCPTLCDPIGQPTRLPCPWDSPGKNAGVGCHFLPQRMKVKSLSGVRPSVTPLTAAHQAPPSMLPQCVVIVSFSSLEASVRAETGLYH